MARLLFVPRPRTNRNKPVPEVKPVPSEKGERKKIKVKKNFKAQAKKNVLEHNQVRKKIKCQKHKNLGLPKNKFQPKKIINLKWTKHLKN